MPETSGSSSRTGKSARKPAGGSHREVSGSKKTAKTEGSDKSKSPSGTSRSKNLKEPVDLFRKTDAGIVRSTASGSGRKAMGKSIGAHDATSSSYTNPEREVAPIRDLIKKASIERQAAVRPKESKPKTTKEPIKPAAKKSSTNPPQIDLEDARKKAAEAALSRLEHSGKIGFIKENPSQSRAAADQLAVQSVLHVCPTVSREVRHLRDWRPRIITYLSELERTEKELSAVLTIHTLNSSKDKVDECIQILVTYLKNIMTNPDEEKYRLIKMTNKVFLEKVLPIKGATDFLHAAGFREDERIEADGAKVAVMYLPGVPDVDKMEMLVDALRSAEPILPQVYRDPVVLKPHEADEKVYLPDDFYDLTEKELAELYKRNMQKLEEESPLMTKAMREKEERKHLAKYKYTVLRVRFPDTVILQGTFGRLDPQKSVKEFVNSCLVRPFNYSLYSPLTKSPLLDKNDEKTMLELKLIPSAVLNFIPEDKDKFPKIYLKDSLIKNMKAM